MRSGDDKRYNKREGSYLISALIRFIMEIRIYEDRCLSCNDSLRFDVIHFHAKKHGLKVSRRRVYILPELKKEADVFGVPMPFIELNGKTLDFFAVGTYLLEDKALEQFINEAKNEKNTD